MEWTSLPTDTAWNGWGVARKAPKGASELRRLVALHRQNVKSGPGAAFVSTP